MTNISAPAVVLSIATAFSSASILAGEFEDAISDKMNAVMTSPEFQREQRSQLQEIMLKQNIWKTNEDGNKINIRFFESSSELSGFQDSCKFEGGKGIVTDGEVGKKVQGLFHGVCIYPK